MKINTTSSIPDLRIPCKQFKLWLPITSKCSNQKKCRKDQPPKQAVIFAAQLNLQLRQALKAYFSSKPSVAVSG